MTAPLASAPAPSPGLQPAGGPAPELSIVIPCYNEGARLEPVVHALIGHLRVSGRAAATEVLLVDDGSQDNTWSLIASLTLEHPHLVRGARLAVNQGKGAAVRHGLRAARGELVLYADADGATRWSDLDVLVAALDDPRVGAAVGTRDGHQVEAHPLRRAVGHLFRLAARALVPVGCDDTQCGFKMLRSSVLPDVLDRLRIDRYAFDVELLWWVRHAGWAFACRDVAWTHQPGSKVHVVRDGCRMLRDLWQLRRRLPRHPAARLSARADLAVIGRRGASGRGVPLPGSSEPGEPSRVG